MLDAARFTIPYPEHPYFVGRDDDLARLHEALNGDAPVGINPAALGNPTGLTGQGGIGKTQLAVAYAFRYRDHFPDGVYWLNAAEDLRQEFAGLGRHLLGQDGQAALKSRIWETLRTQFSVEEIRDLCLELGVEYEEFSREAGRSALAREIVDYFERRGRLSLLEGAIRRKRGDLATLQAQDELIDHVFGWLHEHPRSLLIFDNLGDPATLDEPLIRNNVPSRLPARLLFTTRRRELGRFRPVELKTLERSAALELLLRSRGGAEGLDKTGADFNSAEAICAMVGDLPLALEIAAAQLQDLSDISISEYRAELRIRGALDVLEDQRVSIQVRHSVGLTAVLIGQWDRLTPEAQMLMRVAGQLWEAVNVPEARLGLLAGIPDKGKSVFDPTYKRVVARLADLSLIERLEGDRVRLHPIVHAFARKQAPEGLEAEFREQCIRRLLAAFGDIDTLERQCDSRGIDELIKDLIATEALLDRVMILHETRVELINALRTYLRVLRREAHNLRSWRREDAPNFLAQQLHLRLFDSATPALFGDLAARLRSRGPAWLPRWAARVESPALEMALVGHEGGVNAVAVTPDGRRAVSGGDDGTLRVWNLDTGAAEQTLAGHEGSVWTVAVTPDGRRAFSGGSEGLRIWNLDSGAAEQMLAGDVDKILAVTVTTDGRRVVCGGEKGLLYVWNLESGKQELTLAGHEGWVGAVAGTRDGRRLVSCGYDGLRVWNLDTEAEERTLFRREDRIKDVAVTPDGRLAVFCGNDWGLRVWNLDTGAVELRQSWDMSLVEAVAMMSDGRRAVSGGSDGLYVWNLDSGAAEMRLAGQAGWVRSVAVTQDGRQAISGGDDGTVRIWNLDSGAAERTPAGHEGSVDAVAVTPDGLRAVFGGVDGLRVWNLDTGEPELTLTGYVESVRALAVTSDSRRAVSRGSKGLRVWNLDTGAMGRKLAEHKDRISAVALMPDDRRAIFGEQDGMLHIWDLDSDEPAQTLGGIGDWVHAVAVRKDGRRAVSAGGGGLRVWNLETSEPAQTPVMDAVLVHAVAVTPDGRRVISGGDDGLRVWSLDSGQAEMTLAGRSIWVEAVAVTLDGMRVVSGARDQTLRLWDLDTGRELARAALDAAVQCVAVAPVQPLVIAGDAAGGVICLEWLE